MLQQQMRRGGFNASELYVYMSPSSHHYAGGCGLSHVQFSIEPKTTNEFVMIFQVCTSYCIHGAYYHFFVHLNNDT
ncbi:hypothetical protein ACET3X_001175 [Alternaria dauci]|uniref:Uncharacterized protein n=1 Tax=Alternaria dauci TaxID=48095 RepID=A0ABR3UXM5_9PLEO